MESEVVSYISSRCKVLCELSGDHIQYHVSYQVTIYSIM